MILVYLVLKPNIIILLKYFTRAYCWSVAFVGNKQVNNYYTSSFIAIAYATYIVENIGYKVVDIGGQRLKFVAHEIL